MSKKKNYFVISSIVIIFLSIVSILNVDSSREAMLEIVSKIPGAFGERMASVYSNNAIFVVPSVLSIVIGIIILFVVFFNKFYSKKNLLLFLSIALFVISGNTFVSILSIVNIILAATIKGENIRKEKKEIPKLERFSAGKKGIIGAILCFVVYFSQMFIPDFNSYFVSIIIYLLVLGILIFIFKDNLKRDILMFKDGYREYISYVLPKIGIMYIVYFICCIICVLINKNMPVNQQQIEALPIWYTFPLASLFAPIVEEILFRGCIRRFIKNDMLFIIISGAIFGLLHTISEGSVIGALIMAVPYSVLGCGFAYIYAKTNNITNNILCHSCHNTIVMLLQIILL